MNPRASYPAYSLSRGAPSASWVLLHIMLWRRERDSNPRCLATSLVFKTSALNHSAISPSQTSETYYNMDRRFCQYLQRIFPDIIFYHVVVGCGEYFFASIEQIFSVHGREKVYRERMGFVNDDGQRLSYEALRYQTQCLCKAAGVPYRGEHVFRHTFATNCYHKWVDVKILSRLLGHADVNITYNIYVHLYGDGFDEMYSALVSGKLKKSLFFSEKLSWQGQAILPCKHSLCKHSINSNGR